MAAYALVKYNNYISKASCVSPAIGSVSGQLWREMNNTEISSDTRIYLSWGTLSGEGHKVAGSPDEFREMQSISSKEGYWGIKNPDEEDHSSWLYKTCKATGNKIINAGGQAKLFCQVGGRHCEEDWEKQLGIFMPFLWQDR